MKSLKTEIKYALLSAGTLVIWVMTEHLLGFNTTKMETGEYTRPMIVILVLLFLFLGIREKRDKEFNGQITFLQGLKTAFFISLFYAILQGAWFAIYTNLINPDYLALSIQFQEKQLLEQGKTVEQITDELAFTKKIFNGGILQFSVFIFSTTIIDTIIGVIMTLFLRRKNRKLEN